MGKDCGIAGRDDPRATAAAQLILSRERNERVHFVALPKGMLEPPSAL